MTQTNVPDRTRHVLQQMLQMAYERVDRTFWPGRVAAADLLRERYNNDEADGSVSDYNAALKINPNIPAAHVGLGEVALEGWQFEKVEEQVQAALAVNPNFAPAHHLLAKKLIRERRYEQAIAACDKALAINPNDLTAMSISAGAAACRYDDKHVGEMAQRTAAINPKCAQFHRIVGDSLSGIRQYPASEREFLTAIELDPTDANARTELGMMYMQWGHEEKARAALDAAFAIDPFNQRTKFTLDLLDQLHHFATHESAHFLVRFDAARDPGLGAYVAEYLESIYEAVTTDYAFEPKEKTIIEFFPTMRAFAVRITGEPWIHTVGACTGRVIALSTPREAAVGAAPPYNLANVLTHEFTHTVTLAATENRIAHWFTEGLAVYQEDSPRAFIWIELLVDAIRHDRLFTLESIDWGFVRPQRQGDRQMAYAQAEWMVEYIVERFGYDSIKRMLDKMREGATQSDVFRVVLKIEPESFEKDFGVWAREQAKTWCFDLAPAEDVAKLRELVSLPPCEVDQNRDRQGAEHGATGDARDNNLPSQVDQNRDRKGVERHSLGQAATESGRACAALLGRLARAEYDAEEFEAADKAARTALDLDENERKALTVLVALYAQQQAQLSPRDPRARALADESLPYIERLMEVDKEGWFAAKARAGIALHREEWDVAKKTLAHLQAACPIDPFSWQGLAAVYLEEGDEAAALPQLTELARIFREDPDVPAKIGDIVRKKGNLPEAQYWYKQALAIDPFDVTIHRNLGDVCMEVSDAACALREYKMLTLIEPDKALHFEAAAIAAKKAGDTNAMKQFATRAVELNPQSAARNLIE
jgi:tetratricopeptide (TPR) repeat protein